VGEDIAQEKLQRENVWLVREGADEEQAARLWWIGGRLEAVEVHAVADCGRF
jgi:hypothetical protein